jgi:hypothetical protein
MPISTKLDGLFARHAGPIPVPFLRALAYHESGFNPRNVNAKSNATGLFQITAVALADFNRQNGTKHGLADLVDAELATRVAVRHLGEILKLYATVSSLRPDWTSRRFLELLVFGWNSGHNGVARLAKALEAQGIGADRVTVDTVGQLATTTKVPYLSEPARISWAKTVATTALTPLPGEAVAASPTSARPGFAAVATPVVLAAAVVGAGVLAFNLLGSVSERRVHA